MTVVTGNRWLVGEQDSRVRVHNVVIGPVRQQDVCVRIVAVTVTVRDVTARWIRNHVQICRSKHTHTHTSFQGCVSLVLSMRLSSVVLQVSE